MLAEERGRGIEFAEQTSGVIWSTDDWHKGDHLADATRRAGLDLAEHWGVPTCVFDGEPFFGQDRLDLLLWGLEQNGLKELSAHGRERGLLTRSRG